MSNQGQSSTASAGLKEAQSRNQAFAAAGGHEGAEMRAALRLFVITCMDPRLDPAHFMGLRLGDAIVLRNGGGRVTTEVINNLAFISERIEPVVPEGPLFEVALIHHTHCAAAALADEEFLRQYARRVEMDESLVRDFAVVDPVETVAKDAAKLLAASSISPRVAVSGHVYDVESGLLTTVVPTAMVGTVQAAA